MARPTVIAAALLVCALASGCGRSGTEPAPQAAPEAADASIASGVANASGYAKEADALRESPASPQDEAARVRRAVRDFVAAQHPKSEVEGVWLLPVRGNYCFAGADAVIDARHVNIDVLVRQYVREDGSAYWRGEGFGPNSERAMQSQMRSAPPDPDES